MTYICLITTSSTFFFFFPCFVFLSCPSSFFSSRSSFSFSFSFSSFSLRFSSSVPLFPSSCPPIPRVPSLSQSSFHPFFLNLFRIFSCYSSFSSSTFSFFSSYVFHPARRFFSFFCCRFFLFLILFETGSNFCNVWLRISPWRKIRTKFFLPCSFGSVLKNLNKKKKTKCDIYMYLNKVIFYFVWLICINQDFYFYFQFLNFWHKRTSLQSNLKRPSL